MSRFKIKKGLNIPISGAPEQSIQSAQAVKTVALLGSDYPGMKPTLLVKETDKVKLGEPLFEDKKCSGVIYTSPASGTVKKINRGKKRAFLSMVIELAGDEAVSFPAHTESEIDDLDQKQVRHQLLQSGLWTALRRRPFGKVADPKTTPHSIFVTAMDTEPLAPAIHVVVAGKEKAFSMGLKVIEKLTEGKIHICLDATTNLPIEDTDRRHYHVFEGPHPAGLAGTHIHHLDPVSLSKTVWQIGIQDVIAIGKLFSTGEIHTERVIALAGPLVKKPRLIETRLGASLLDLTNTEIKEEGEPRRISGSVLSGSKANDEVLGYLGRYHQQVSVIKEGSPREFLGMVMPGANRFSIKNVFLSKLFFGKTFDFTSATNGSKRAMVPIGCYEKVMPLDIIPTYLLRSAIVRDTDKVVDLGGLELIEEDVALCTFVCPSKYDYAPILRDNLTIIEKEEVEG